MERDEYAFESSCRVQFVQNGIPYPAPYFVPTSMLFILRKDYFPQLLRPGPDILKLFSITSSVFIV